VAEPRADRRPPVSPRELGQAGDTDRPVLAVDDQEVEQLAALALAPATRIAVDGERDHVVEQRFPGSVQRAASIGRSW
jgi:hypothetical protein